MNEPVRTEWRWHAFVVACSSATALAVLVLPESSVLRQALGLTFVFMVPGMAVAGRSLYLRRLGLTSLQSWAVVFPVSFAVGVGGSLAMVYLVPWSPTLLMLFVALASGASSADCLSGMRDRGIGA